MAIQQTQQPIDFSPSRRVHQYLNSEPDIYTCLSDNVNETNFRYVFKIKTEDGFLDKTKAPPWTNSIGVNTVNKKLRSLNSYEFDPTIDEFTSIGDDRVINYGLYCEENYIGVTDTEITGFTKCIALPVRTNTFNPFSFMLRSTPYDAGKVLSDFSGNRKIRISDEATISVLNGQFKPSDTNEYVSKPYRCYIKVWHDSLYWDLYYISNEASQTTAWTDLSTDNATLQDMSERLISVPVGPINTKAAVKKYAYSYDVSGLHDELDVVITPTISIIESTDVKYQVYFTPDTDYTNRNSEIITYEIDSVCPNVYPIRISWENFLGGTDYFNFSLVSNKVVNVSKNTFQKERMNINGTAASYPTYDGGETIYDVNFNETYLANSDIMSVEESLALESLWTSENVYAKIGDTWYPIILENDSVPIYDAQYNDMIQYSVTFRKSNRGFGTSTKTIDASGASVPSNENLR